MRIEYILTDQRYGVNAFCEMEQVGGTNYCRNLTNHPDIDVLENFTSGLPTDPFRWIPKGLMYDLMDNSIELTLTGVNDQVSGFTIAQIFAALQSDVTSVPACKARFIQQNPGNQTTQINSLFSSYNY